MKLKRLINPMNKTEKWKIILFGYDFDNDEYSHVNTRINKSILNYIAIKKF